MALMSVTVAPIRFVIRILMIILAGLLSWIGMIGVSESDLASKPLTGWRRWLQKFLYRMGRWAFFCIGVHKLTITGEKVRLLVAIIAHISTDLGPSSTMDSILASHPAAPGLILGVSMNVSLSVDAIC